MIGTILHRVLSVPTKAKIALLSLVDIALPQAEALADPTNTAPTEQIDRSRRALSEEGRKEAACTIGKMGWDLAKYNLIHSFYEHSQYEHSCLAY